MVSTVGEGSSTLLSLSNNLADAAEQAGQSTVAVNARERLPSSGVVWRPGVIVTADHTVEREEGIMVILPDGSKAEATLAGRDSGTDLAVLRVGQNEVPSAQLGDPAMLRVGTIVLAVARPGDSGLSASWGAISAVGGPWRTWTGGQIEQFVRPDLTLYPGFSGGPLVDASGKIAGINTSGLSRSMSLTIPGSTVTRVVEHLLSKGRMTRGYLGLGMQRIPLPDTLKSSLNLPGNGGLIVISVESGGPAEKAGILLGDVLVAIDNKPVSETDHVQALLDPERVGSTVKAQLVRGGTPVELSITVGERPHRGA